VLGPVPMSKYEFCKERIRLQRASIGDGPSATSLVTSKGRARLLRLVFKQAIKSTQRVGVLLFLTSQLVNPSRDGGGGVLRFTLYVAAGGVPALLESRLRPPLSLGELDDSDSRVCAHDRSGRRRASPRLLAPEEAQRNSQTKAGGPFLMSGVERSPRIDPLTCNTREKAGLCDRTLTG
jgi:hypothetical protein